MPSDDGETRILRFFCELMDESPIVRRPKPGVVDEDDKHRQNRVEQIRKLVKCGFSPVFDEELEHKWEPDEDFPKA